METTQRSQHKLFSSSQIYFQPEKMFCLSFMSEINLDKNDRYKKAFKCWLYMGFLVSLLSDRLLHLISFCGPLLRGGVLGCSAGLLSPIFPSQHRTD